MTDPTDLRAEARALSSAALRCRTLADEIEQRRAWLAPRIDEVLARHTVEVWNSTAADVSRAVLTRDIAPALGYLGVDLATTVRLLRGESDDLEARSVDLVGTAGELETAALEAGALDDEVGA